MISSDEAGRTLSDIDSTIERTRRGLDYRAGSPHLVIWGIIWMAGYGLSAVLPAMHLHWPVLVLAGAIASGVAGARMGGIRGGGWKFAATACLVTGFFLALFAILPPLSPAQIGVIFPLIVSVLYGGVSIWSCRARFGVTGAVVGIAALAAYFLIPAWFDAIMAIAGGGGLILGGLWMRSW